MDCFILKSGSADADIYKTLESLQPIAGMFKPVDMIEQINYEEKQSNWFAVFYDNESIGEALCNALPIYLQYSEKDCLVLCKHPGEKMISKCPKIFKKNILLKDNNLLPVNDYTYQVVLDGFVWEHAQDRV